MKSRLWLAAFAVLAGPVFAQTSSTGEAAAPDAAYTRTLNERAHKIVTPLGLSDAAQSNRVHALIVQQYRDLNVIHSERDARIKAARAGAQTNSPADKAAADAAIVRARADAQARLDQLHPAFLKRLAGELTPEQIEQVKDGMTYGVAPNTYAVYLRMFPDLTDAQKQYIKLQLHEARELAMDGSTAEEKHAVFGKYKGRINNYLVKAGYDLKQGEANLKRTSRPASEKSSTP